MNNLQELYRIEHTQTGNGMFYGDEYYFSRVLDREDALEFDTRWRAFPGVSWRDTELCDHFKHGKHFCAFLDTASIRKFVKKQEMLQFKQAGYRLYRLKVRECITSQYQAIFEKDHIEEKEDITEHILAELI